MDGRAHAEANLNAALGRPASDGLGKHSEGAMQYQVAPQVALSPEDREYRKVYLGVLMALRYPTEEQMIEAHALGVKLWECDVRMT